MTDFLKNVPEEHIKTVTEWNDVPISVEDMLKAGIVVCSFCDVKEQQQIINCFDKLSRYGLGKHCYKAYSNYRR